MYDATPPAEDQGDSSTRTGLSRLFRRGPQIEELAGQPALPSDAGRVRDKCVTNANATRRALSVRDGDTAGGERAPVNIESGPGLS